MITHYYDIMLAVSLALMLVYTFMWHRHFDVHITLVFLLVPINNLGCALLARAQTLEAALVANKVIYIGGCFLPLAVMFITFSLCHVPLSRWLRTGFLALGAALYLSSTTAGTDIGIFYKSVSLERMNGISVLVGKQYGVMHTVLYGFICACFLLCVAAIVYSYFKKKQVSRKTICLMILPLPLSLAALFGGRRIIPQVELLPLSYNIALVTYLVIVYRMCLYDVTETAIDSLVEAGDTGFISFDFRLNYLASNRTARKVFPELNALTVDRPIKNVDAMQDTALKWLAAFRENPEDDQATFEREGRCYLVRTTWLFDGSRKRGYQLFITDDTENQQYIGLLNSFNSELQSEVAQKTAHIVEMHDQLILGMATMVESRDNSTGGHIRRTSEGVRLLVDEMRRDPECDLSDEFCRDIVKAAPMHDLGKIAVDDAVLRKPGRFTPEEFEKMKAHAAEGARIVREILKCTEDEGFKRIAENVAHYHHERWDGSGYPEGLKGEAIPLEARIMAIADVYDALVSKRVYKESMSFDQAHGIIMDGMGKHFDARLEPFYLAAKPKLEAYYTSLA